MPESAVQGDELAALEQTERAARIGRVAIFARISPGQKFLVVDGLKSAGAIVAMTGERCWRQRRWPVELQRM